MNPQNTENGIQPKRIVENAGSMLIAGLSMHCSTKEVPAGVPALWQKFDRYSGQIPGQKSKIAFGLCIEQKEGSGIKYLAGTEAADEYNLPDVFETKRLPSFTYAVFEHQGHVSEIYRTCDAIWTEWIPASGAQKPENADFFFERYGEGFDPVKGQGDIEIWLPVKL